MSINASGEHDSSGGVPLIRSDRKQVAAVGTSEYSFGNVSEQVGYVIGDLPGKVDSGHEANQIFIGAEGLGQRPWVGWGKGAGECLEQ